MAKKVYCDSCEDEIKEPDKSRKLVIFNGDPDRLNTSRQSYDVCLDCFETVIEDSETFKGLVFSDED